MLAGLAHDGGADNHSERVECDLGAVTVRIRHAIRREHSIVDLRGPCCQPRRGPRRASFRAVVGNHGCVVEWIEKPPWKEEMFTRQFQFLAASHSWGA